MFAGAAKTPVATIVMAVDLFGPAIACMASYLFSGHAGIYHAQRVGHSMPRRALPKELRIADIAQYLKQAAAKTRGTTRPCWCLCALSRGVRTQRGEALKCKGNESGMAGIRMPAHVGGHTVLSRRQMTLMRAANAA